MIYFIFGEDRFRIREQVEELKKQTLASGAEIVLLEAPAITPDELSERMTLETLFSSKRVFFLRNFFASGNRLLQEKTIHLLSKLPDNQPVVFWEEGEPDRRTRLFSFLIRRAKLLEKPLLRGGKLLVWIQERARKKGAQLTPPAAKMLAQLIGSDLGQIDADLERLSLYALDRPITEDDVGQQIPTGIAPSIFELLDALGGKTEEMAVLSHRLLSAGEDPLRLLAMLSYQIRNLLLLHDLISHRPAVTPAVVARELHLHPFVAEKIWRQGQRFTYQELMLLHRRLTELDMAIKTGGIDPADALAMLSSKRRAG